LQSVSNYKVFNYKKYPNNCEEEVAFNDYVASRRIAPDVPSHSSQLDYIIRRHLRPEKRNK